MTATLSKPLRLLLVEDEAPDATLTIRAVRSAGFDVEYKRVETREEIVLALATEDWSVILCDYYLPTIDAPMALDLVKASGKDIPFIIVSGTLGEEAATVAMRHGAHDYFLKGRLGLLGSAIERELRDADERRRRREAEASVVQARERFRLIVESSSDFVSIIEADGMIRYQSPTIEKVLGHAASDITGTTFFDLVHPEDRARVRRGIGDVFATADSTQSVAFRMRDSRRLWRPVESVCHNRAQDEEVRGVIMSTRDMSERNAIVEAQNALMRAELASRTKSAFLANMSHELRTPLNAIIGFSELMEQGLAGPLSERQRDYVSAVVQSGRHLLNIVNDILDLSKIEAGRMDLDREWTPLASVIDAVGMAVMPLALKRDVLLLLRVDDSLPDVFIDPVRMKQVLYNVLSNGIKFTPAQGRVELVAWQKDGAIEIEISDTGIGIRAEDLPRLFKEFEQLQSGGDKPEGTGLGLALTKRLLEMHGGTLSVTSEYGTGTTFTLTLPVLRRVNGSDMPSVFRSADAEEAQVLVVEDDASSAELLAEHLRAAGVSVAIATSGVVAMQQAAKLKPRVITLDLIVPGDGWAILRRLKEDQATRNIPVVIISVVDEAPRALSLGAAAYLVKPVTRDALIGAVEGCGVSLCRVAGVAVLLVGDDSPALLDLWEKLHAVGCQVQRAVRLSIPMTDAEPDIVIVVENEDGPFSMLGHARFASVPVMVLGTHDGADAFDAGVHRLCSEDVRRSEVLVRKIRAVLDRGVSEARP